MLASLRSLIVDGSVESRAKLRETLKSLALKEECEQAKTFTKAVEKVRFTKFDIVFIASSFNEDDIKRFVNQCRNLPEIKKQPIYIVTVQVDEQHSTLLSRLMLNGVSGFIFEPFSSDQLLEVLEIMKNGKVTAIDQKNKQNGAVGLLLTDAINQIDQLAMFRIVEPRGGGYALKHLRQISDTLKEFYKGTEPEYAAQLIEAFERAKPPDEKYFARKREREKNRKSKAPHPGKVLAGLLKSRGLSLDRLNSSLKTDPALVEAVLNGTGSINKDLAANLARVLGETSSYWLGLQRKFDLEQPKT